MFIYKLKKLYRYRLIPFLILFSITMGVVVFFYILEQQTMRLIFLIQMTSPFLIISVGMS